MTITRAAVRAAGRVDLSDVLAMAVAFYSEDGFATAEPELRDNLATLLARGAGRRGAFGGSVARLRCHHNQFRSGERIGRRTGGSVRGADRAASGLARLLIEDSVEWAGERGCRCLELGIAPNGRDVGHLFPYYLARGFRNDGRRLISRQL
ncbi:hypothetical protein [Nocardia sp. CA-135398]|uniref:hypothetical protein n=1 Tax=Nocardia sp. CA-135398 TaxID=3239977 RepID=UPI003D968CB5